MIETDRLLLRQWVTEDFHPFAEMCSNKKVMEFFPKIQTPEESYEMARKIQSLINERGWGLWAVEIPNQHAFIGFIGLHAPQYDLPCSPCVEVGWRLSSQYWGKGYATEGAKAALEFAFNTLQLSEVVSFTTVGNVRSVSVMKKIGMQDSGQNFMHPGIDESHPQCEYVLYKISQSE
jgi:ribosomal-protein-alanine N-acetyltransferase